MPLGEFVLNIGLAYTEQYEMVLNTNRKNVHHTNLHPSIHPSPPVPDVLPDACGLGGLLVKNVP